MTLLITVACDKCGYALVQGMSPLDRRPFLLHQHFGCERDGQTFELPSVEIKRL
jgi:hypothetical protein